MEARARAASYAWSPLPGIARPLDGSHSRTVHLFLHGEMRGECPAHCASPRRCLRPGLPLYDRELADGDGGRARASPRTEPSGAPPCRNALAQWSTDLLFSSTVSPGLLARRRISTSASRCRVREASFGELPAGKEELLLHSGLVQCLDVLRALSTGHFLRSSPVRISAAQHRRSASLPGALLATSPRGRRRSPTSLTRADHTAETSRLRWTRPSGWIERARGDGTSNRPMRFRRAIAGELPRLGRTGRTRSRPRVLNEGGARGDG